MDEDLKQYFAEMKTDLIEQMKAYSDHSLGQMKTELIQEMKAYSGHSLGQMKTELIQEMKAYSGHSLGQIKTELIEEMKAYSDRQATALKNDLIEQMRGMQTELLRGFAAFSTAQTIRLRKVEADQSNLDSSLSGRLNIVEDRLLQIEHRLGMQ